MNRSAEGFTLVEIMIVVAIIGLLASIAIPALIRAKMNARENFVKQDLKAFSTANEMFRADQNPTAYSPDIPTLVASNPSYLDPTWLLNPRHEFTLNYTGGINAYSLLAAPASAGVALNTYCVDQTGVVVGSVEGAGAPAAGANGCQGGTPIP